MMGYFCDVGTPLSYYRCCVDALEGRLSLPCAPEFRPAPEPETPATAEEGFTLDCPCRDRAGIMGTLSEQLLELEPDYSDGLRLQGERYRLHIAPRAVFSALRVCVQSPDTEFARGLALSAKALIEALGNE